jgi:hypothetical protein
MVNQGDAERAERRRRTQKTTTALLEVYRYPRGVVTPALPLVAWKDFFHREDAKTLRKQQESICEICERA